jgi:general secretion pathway protein M
MITMDRIRKSLERYPVAAAGLFAVVLIVCIVTSADNVLDVLQRREAVASAREILERMETRGSPRAANVATDVGVPVGSAFIEGASASVAGASLLQRMTGAIRRLRGNILSSQVDLQGPQAKAGVITATSSFEIEQPSLQPLLYDLEAGMPFLFVEQLVVQAPSGVGESGKLRVLMSVSGKWQGAK